MILTVKIENVYDDGTVSRIQDVEVPTPPNGDDDREDWAYDHLFPLTGTGRPDGEAGYFVTITAAEDMSLVGTEFQWGL